MICTKCGKDNSGNARFCAYCGAVLPAGAEEKGKKGGIILAIIIILILIAGIISGILIYNNINSDFEDTYAKETSKKNETSPTQTPSVGTVVIPEKIEEPEKTIPPKKTGEVNEQLKRKNEFLEKADEIEEYAEEYLNTAGNQHEINSESGIVYQKWDGLLNDVYQYLKTTMPESEFKALQKDELEWIKEKESAVEESARDWLGGSGEAMARNMTAIEYTEERCYYLISLIN